MNICLYSLLIVAAVASLLVAHPLKRSNKICTAENCKLPDCRCWNATYRPGNFSETYTPQIIVLSFDYSFNDDTVAQYLKIFESLTNPNGCPAKGTFFVQALDSEAATIKKLYDAKHEIAMNSANGIIPTSTAEWKDTFGEVMKLIKKAGVPESKVKGVRAPSLFNGGNDEFTVLEELKLKYEASCVNVDYSTPQKLLWPYTLDFVDKNFPRCDIGHTVNQSYAGIWSFPMPVLNYHDLQCPTPSGCLGAINSTDNVFDLFFNAFDAHYYNNRAPLVLDIDPQWVTEDYRVMGTKEFLEIVAAYQDTWIITMGQALEWIQDPHAMHNSSSFDKWSC